ncbi:MAG: flagellar protein FlaG [Lachnospiraceae bacterium]|nr:flagellar protein FlaG [Lachnospiraceae bacterium]
MAIEGISSNTMSQQVTRVEKPAPVESTEAVQVTPKEITPVKERQSGYEDKEKNPSDEGKNIQDVSAEKVKKAVEEINKKIRPTHTQCEFKFHEKTNRLSITVRDSETQEVIKEIPPEKTLDMIAKTLELAGLLVDEKR